MVVNMKKMVGIISLALLLIFTVLFGCRGLQKK